MARNRNHNSNRLNWKQLVSFALTLVFILCLANRDFEPYTRVSQVTPATTTTPVATRVSLVTPSVTPRPTSTPTPTITPALTPTVNSATVTAASSLAWTRHWLEDNPCSAPCWEGITPGLTTFDETLQILKRLKFVRSLATDDYASIRIRWTFASSENSYSENTIYFDDRRRVKVVFLTFPGFKVNDVLQKFGEPDYVWAQRNIPNSLTLLLLKKGITITTTSNKAPVLNEDALFTMVSFTAPGDLTDYQIDTQYPYSLTGLPLWQGYKSFDFYWSYWHDKQ